MFITNLKEGMLVELNSIPLSFYGLPAFSSVGQDYGLILELYVSPEDSAGQTFEYAKVWLPALKEGSFKAKKFGAGPVILNISCRGYLFKEVIFEDLPKTCKEAILNLKYLTHSNPIIREFIKRVI